jgi:hypothetical protein
LKPWKEAVNKLKEAPTPPPVDGLVCQLSFNNAAEFPQIQFEWVNYVTEEIYAAVKAISDKEIDRVVGKGSGASTPPVWSGEDVKPAVETKPIKTKGEPPTPPLVEKAAQEYQSRERAPVEAKAPIAKAEAVVAEPEEVDDDLDATLEDLFA